MSENSAMVNGTAFDPLRGAGETATTCVISLRLPSALVTALEQSATKANLPCSGTLDALLRHSFENSHLLIRSADCPGLLNAKLDIRLPIRTSHQLKITAKQLGMPVSVYIRKLLYHFYVTKRIGFVQSDGHYTLAGRHD